MDQDYKIKTLDGSYRLHVAHVQLTIKFPELKVKIHDF